MSLIELACREHAPIRRAGIWKNGCDCETITDELEIAISDGTIEQRGQGNRKNFLEFSK